MVLGDVKYDSKCLSCKLLLVAAGRIPIYCMLFVERCRKSEMDGPTVSSMAQDAVVNVFFEFSDSLLYRECGERGFAFCLFCAWPNLV